MTPDRFHTAALALPGVIFDVKWSTSRIYSVGGKMFAAAGAEGGPAPHYSFKVSDLSFIMLIE